MFPANTLTSFYGWQIEAKSRQAGERGPAVPPLRRRRRLHLPPLQPKPCGANNSMLTENGTKAKGIAQEPVRIAQRKGAPPAKMCREPAKGRYIPSCPALTFLQHAHFETLHEATRLARLAPPFGDLALVGGRAAVLDIACGRKADGRGAAIGKLGTRLPSAKVSLGDVLGRIRDVDPLAKGGVALPQSQETLIKENIFGKAANRLRRPPFFP